MEILTFNNYNPNWKNKVYPKEIIKSNFGYLYEALKALKIIKPELTNDYINAVKKRLHDEIQDYQINPSIFQLSDIEQFFPELVEFTELQELIVKFTAKYLELEESHSARNEPIELLQINIARAQDIFSFYRTKAFVDLLGRKKGIELWKKLVANFVADRLNQPDSKKLAMKDFIKEMQSVCYKSGGSDCIFVVFDDYRMLQKIDRCICHEGTKHLNDPEIAYLSYCYTDDVADSRTKGLRRIRRRRSQTLYFADFCDEFYWDDEIKPEAKQPPLEFMRKLGKEDPKEIIKEYEGKV
ncbi:MAG: hypothetical protein FK732_05345 [Asgard group archaeon]|nr:hypothetical protein [Asgard group archaeon]